MTEISAQEWASLREDIGELKDAMKEMAKAMERLARLEERDIERRSSIDRAFSEITKLEARVVALEQQAPASNRTNAWIDKFLWAVLGVCGMFIAKKLGMV